MKQNLLIATILVLLMALIFACKQKPNTVPTPRPIVDSAGRIADCDTSVCIPYYISSGFADSLRDHSFNITTANAIAMRNKYLLAKTLLTNSGADTLIKLTYGEVFSRAALLELLSRDSVSGIWFTHGLDNQNRQKLIMMPVLTNSKLDPNLRKEMTPIDTVATDLDFEGDVSLVAP